MVGPGAKIQAPVGSAATGTITVHDGASLFVVGVEIDLRNGPFRCLGMSALSAVRLEDVGVTAIQATYGGSQFTIDKCAATFRSVDLTLNGIVVSNDGGLDADRMQLRPSVDHASVSAIGSRMTLRIVNSVLYDGQVLVSEQDQAPSISNVYLAFSTIYSTFAIAMNCNNSSAGNWMARVENNVFAGATSNALVGTTCIANHNVLFPQSDIVPGSNIVQDPRFVDATMHDLRLRSDSPAIDVAVPSPQLSTDHDVNGRARPQGGAPDIGAYEF